MKTSAGGCASDKKGIRMFANTMGPFSLRKATLFKAKISPNLIMGQIFAFAAAALCPILPLMKIFLVEMAFSSEIKRQPVFFTGIWIEMAKTI